MSTAVALQQDNLDLLEKLIVNGDLSKLSQEERLRYYALKRFVHTCGPKMDKWGCVITGDEPEDAR